MATKGDVSDLDTLQYGGEYLCPLVSDFARSRRSGVVNSSVAGGATRQRRKYRNTVYDCTLSFFIEGCGMMDYIKAFMNRNLGKKFIVWMKADRPLIEPYVVQVIGDWQDSEVDSRDERVTIQVEVFSTSEPCLDDFLSLMYGCAGDDTTAIITGINELPPHIPNSPRGS